MNEQVAYVITLKEHSPHYMHGVIRVFLDETLAHEFLHRNSQYNNYDGTWTANKGVGYYTLSEIDVSTDAS